jgi:hypothetical protein
VRLLMLRAIYERETLHSSILVECYQHAALATRIATRPQSTRWYGVGRVKLVGAPKR